MTMKMTWMRIAEYPKDIYLKTFQKDAEHTTYI